MNNTEFAAASRKQPGARRALTIGAALALTACGVSESQEKGAPGGHGPMQSPQVGVISAETTRAPVFTELPGRTTSFRIAQIRPQVTGVVQRIAFVEGSFVKAGQTLYQIDPRPYQATVAQARANLASAQASAEAARVRVERYRPLAQANAISQQDFTDAQAQAAQANAAVAQTQAALQTAQINLGFTRVPAPISGRIGRSLVTEGALVTASQADALAVVTQLDPIYVDVQQSSTDLLKLRREIAQNGAAPAAADVTLTLEDGAPYEAKGKVQFSEAVVDAATGTVTLRARFPNRQGILLPGMFVRARFAQAVDKEAILVPQQAVTRNPKGDATVALVGAGNKVEMRTVTAARAEGGDWVVTSGLKTGDKIITEGVDKARPGLTVKPVPAGSPETTADGLVLRGRGS